MKNVLLTNVLLLFVTTLFAQENGNKTILLDSLHIPSTDKNYSYIRIIENYKTTKNSYTVSEYYKSGKLSMTGLTNDKDILKFEGLRIDYYENGNKKQESNYIDNKLNGTQIKYYKNGNIKQESNYKDNKLNGQLTEWYENNQKKSEKIVNWNSDNKTEEIKILQFWNTEGNQTVIDGNGQMEGTDKEFFEKGEIINGEKEGIWNGKNLKKDYSYTESYKKGKLLSGISTDKDNNKYNYKELSQQPVPAEGMKNFYQYIGNNYKAPKIEGLNGKVYIRFVVDTEGNLGEFRILKDLGYGTGEEAIKIISSYGKWIPGKIKGIPTKAQYSIPLAIKNK